MTYVSCLRISANREESIGRKNKGITLVQWENNCLWTLEHVQQFFKLDAVSHNFWSPTSSITGSFGKAGCLAVSRQNAGIRVSF